MQLFDKNKEIQDALLICLFWSTVRTLFLESFISMSTKKSLWSLEPEAWSRELAFKDTSAIFIRNQGSEYRERIGEVQKVTIQQRTNNHAPKASWSQQKVGQYSLRGIVSHCLQYT